MGTLSTIRKLMKIDAECKKNAELRKKLEPWVEKMNKVKPSNKAEALKVANEMIDKYEELKKDIEDDIRSEHVEVRSVSKIEQINER